MIGSNILAALAASGLLQLCFAQAVIQDDSYFYGQSPPVYPSPQITGSGDWGASYAKAEAFVAQLSLEEKSNLTFGIASTSNGCSGNIPAIARLGFPGMCLQDAGNGVRATDVSQFRKDFILLREKRFSDRLLSTVRERLRIRSTRWSILEQRSYIQQRHVHGWRVPSQRR